MNLQIREIPWNRRGAQCAKEDCHTTAIAVVHDADTGAALVVYCRRHIRELRRELERLTR